jgi:hypothetical protein
LLSVLVVSSQIPQFAFVVCKLLFLHELESVIRTADFIFNNCDLALRLIFESKGEAGKEENYFAQRFNT